MKISPDAFVGVLCVLLVDSTRLRLPSAVGMGSADVGGGDDIVEGDLLSWLGTEFVASVRVLYCTQTRILKSGVRVLQCAQYIIQT